MPTTSRSAPALGAELRSHEDAPERLNLSVPLDAHKEVIAPLGTIFWFRPAALKPLFDHDWQWEDFPPEPNDIDGTILHAIERAYGYVAQASATSADGSSPTPSRGSS